MLVQGNSKAKISKLINIADKCMTCSNLGACGLDIKTRWCKKTGFYKRFDKSLNLKYARTRSGSALRSPINSP